MLNEERYIDESEVINELSIGDIDEAQESVQLLIDILDGKRPRTDLTRERMFYLQNESIMRAWFRRALMDDRWKEVLSGFARNWKKIAKLVLTKGKEF